MMKILLYGLIFGWTGHLAFGQQVEVSDHSVLEKARNDYWPLTNPQLM
ncbi:MAG: hypothetical protein ACI9DF_005947 [Verrucomicrobiales bacterium]|jgi:hypothetical protein